MGEHFKKPRLVGTFIRQRRETLGISQRALGLLFSPPVTTQFISNVERGVTPLPPTHISTLTKALQVQESEITALLKQEYHQKLSGRLSPHDDGGASHDPDRVSSGEPLIMQSGPDSDFIRLAIAAFHQADEKTRQTFKSLCENILNIRKA